MGDRLYIKSLPQEELSGIAALIDNQESAIMAQRLSKNEAMEITLFAVDQGRELTIAASAGETMIQVLGGEVCIHSEETETVSRSGSVRVIPADTDARAVALQPSKILVTAVLQPDIIEIDEDG
jgi:quercetin dioxygenase-like cupin family protein